MNKRSTLQGLILLLFTALTVNTTFSQVFWSETFSSAANWVHGGTNAGTEVWTWTTDPAVGVTGFGPFASTTATDGYFYFNSDANGENNAHDVTLTGTGNPADCTGKTGVKLRFYSQYAEFNAATAQAFVGVSTDGTNFTYHEINANADQDEIIEGNITIDVPEADNQAQVWVQFRWVGAWEYHWKVDDVELFTLAGAVPCDQNPMAIICDNFDTYDTGMTTGQQGTWWTTWSGATGTAEDGIVTTEQANTMPNSMKIESVAANGGPQDVVLDLGNKMTGRYELKWKIYVPSGKNGYYNVQQVVPIGANGDWNLNVFFNNNGDGQITDGDNAELGTFKFPYDTWFECRHIFDLDNNTGTYYMADTFVTKKAYDRNLGGIDFYGTNNVSTFYVDDIEYVEMDPIVFNVDECSGAVDLAAYFGQAPGVAQTTGLYDNTNTTPSMDDPSISCWGENVSGATDVVNNSMWYTFIGDGGKYHIETVPCNATNYIGTDQNDTGDTQMVIYAGDDCSDLQQVICNDDLYSSGTPDWRAGVDLETTNGQNYYMMLDGFEFNGVLATGEFCIEITQIPDVLCTDAVVGTYSLPNNGIVCFNDNLNTSIEIDPASFVIPNLGPVYGMVWSITAAPIPANTWPGTIAGVASTVVNPNVIVVNAPNNGTGLSGQFYLTASVVAGGTLIDPNGVARVFNVDPSAGCFFNGPSILVTFLPDLNPIFADGAFTPPTGPGTNDGAIDLTVTGGLADPPGDPSIMTYMWTGPNGFTASTQNISGLAPGDYTVVIEDPSGCVDPFARTFSLLVDVNDPASVKLLSLSPNPTNSTTLLNLELAKAADVRLEMTNMLGQVVETFDAGKVSNLTRTIDMNNLANGTYLLRVTVDNEVALRRIVLQR